MADQTHLQTSLISSGNLLHVTLPTDAESDQVNPILPPFPNSSADSPNPTKNIPGSPHENGESDSAGLKSLPFFPQDSSPNTPDPLNGIPVVSPFTDSACTESGANQVSFNQDSGHEIPNLAEHNYSELEELRLSYRDLEARSAAMEDQLAILQSQNLDLIRTLEEVSAERDALQNDFCRIEIATKEREDELSKLLDETNKKSNLLLESLDSLQSVKERLMKILERIDEEKMENGIEEDKGMMEWLDLGDEAKKPLDELSAIYKIALRLELRFTEHEEKRRKEIKELDNSIVSLTEENRDISNILRIALVEKEAVEKTLSRLKGGGDQKKVAILQFAERGLQKVGFGFMMGGSSTGDSPENSGTNAGARSDSSECGDEEVVSLASTVEKIMKNLRLEISQLRRSLEESRSDSERLQNLTEKQAQQISENALYIKDLEERESMLTQNVEELLGELTNAEEEVARWREACELEVEAGKAAMEERDKEASILTEELKKTKASLELSNNKLKVKEELAAAAMAAQAAAERSLRLADSRSTAFRERIEELTRQLEEVDKGERKISRRVRHVCWPCWALRINRTAVRRGDVSRRRLPEMQSLLHYNI